LTPAPNIRLLQISAALRVMQNERN